MFRVTTVLTLFSLSLTAQSQVERYGVFETALTSTGTYSNPYVALWAEATLVRPGGEKRTIPLFWDGESNWKVRVSPDLPGKWTYTVDRTILA